MNGCGRAVEPLEILWPQRLAVLPGHHDPLDVLLFAFRVLWADAVQDLDECPGATVTLILAFYV
jgi:hypothetical protein